MLTLGLHLALVPTQYESVPFHVKALKILLHELQNTAEAEKPKVEDAQSDDGVSWTYVISSDVVNTSQDEEWADDDIFQSIKQEEYRFLSGRSGGLRLNIVSHENMPRLCG